LDVLLDQFETKWKVGRTLPSRSGAGSYGALSEPLK
jgi:hypothetical protein